MAILSFCGKRYTVDHAVKGVDFIHGYNAEELMIVSFEGVTDFSKFTYDGEYMSPEMCEAEACNKAILVNGRLRTKDGRNVTASDVGAAPISNWRGTFTGNIDSTEMNGLYWLSSGYTGTVPADMSQYAFIDASARHQRLMYFGNSGITKIYERYYTNNKWYEWVQTDAINLLESIYPVGSIYMSVTNKSPASFLGGTWSQLKDRFLLGAGSSYTNGSTGGASTVTLTVDQMPSHGHTIYDGADERSVGPYGGGDSGSHGITYSHDGRSNTLMASTAGGGKSHNNMPPYLVVYMWKRTA